MKRYRISAWSDSDNHIGDVDQHARKELLFDLRRDVEWPDAHVNVEEVRITGTLFFDLEISLPDDMDPFDLDLGDFEFDDIQEIPIKHAHNNPPEL